MLYSKMKKALAGALVLSLSCGVIGCTNGGSPDTSPRATTSKVQMVDSQKEIEAVLATVSGLLEVYNASETMKMSPEERVKTAGRYYLASDAYSRDDQPLYFGPLSEPVVRGSRAHLANVTMNYNAYADRGGRFTLRAVDPQIRLDGSLAVVVARTTGLIDVGAGPPVAAPGRWTIVLEKVEGQWLISHEHVSFYTD